MSKVPADNLIPGMVLAADVRDRSGRLLLKSGIELTTKHLHILRTWGVVEAEILDKDDHPEVTTCPNAIDPELWKTIEEEISPLFRHADLTHPAIKELLRIRIVREGRYGDR